MYETEPFNTESRKNINLPTNMYALDQLYVTHLTNCDSKMNCIKLEESQHNLLVGMERLKHQITLANKNLKNSQCITVTNKCVSDIVIFFHPSDVPTAIIVAVGILSRMRRVHTQCLLHSSLRNKFQVPHQLQAIHSSLCHDRYEYDFVITFILKDIEKPMMNINVSLPYCISGVSAITKFIFNLTQLNNDQLIYHQDDVVRQTQIDSWIELADCVLTRSNVKNACDELIVKTRERLSKNNWLVGNECSAADLLVHSAIGNKGVHQLGQECNKWIQACSLTAF